MRGGALYEKETSNARFNSCRRTGFDSTSFRSRSKSCAPSRHICQHAISDTYIIKAGKLNVRTEPNHEGDILGTVSSEQKVKVDRFVNADWAQIHFKGKKAYISTHFLMKTASQAKTTKQTAFYTPTPENGKAKQLSSGTEVTILGWGFSENGGFDFTWAFVDYGGVKGYIHTKDLQMR